jgi:hypothetical protein
MKIHGIIPAMVAPRRRRELDRGEPMLIEDGGGYCCIAIHAEGDAVLLAYCAGVPSDRTCFARLRMRRVPHAESG